MIPKGKCLKLCPNNLFLSKQFISFKQFIYFQTIYLFSIIFRLGQTQIRILFYKTISNEKKIDYIVSGLPFVAMSKAQKMEICELSFDNLSKNGIFFQITYFVKCSFPVEIINKNKLIKRLIGFTLLNIPPAFIWSIARRN